jgi:hypothetical protein
MRSGSLRVAIVLLVAAAGAASSGCGVFGRDYEYEEELSLSIDGSATITVNASVVALVALRGAPFEPDPAARPDADRVRGLFAGPGVEVRTPKFSRRAGREFVHVRVDVPDVRQLTRVALFSWSSYQFEQSGEAFVFRQVVGKPSGRPVGDVGWNGEELVAFRMHIPSKVLFENASTDVQRGNILAWEQRLTDRLAGAPIDLHVEMAPESILYSTLLLFGATIVAAAAVFAAAVWWLIRRGARSLAEVTAAPTPAAPRPRSRGYP